MADIVAREFAKNPPPPLRPEQIALLQAIMAPSAAALQLEHETAEDSIHERRSR
jgi:hypothetical protein